MDKFCHHMTINMGPSDLGPAAEILNQEFELTVVSFAQDENVIAVGVETLVPSNNTVKHITLAVNLIGGAKPRQSNDLKDWHPISTLKLFGRVEEGEPK